MPERAGWETPRNLILGETGIQAVQAVPQGADTAGMDLQNWDFLALDGVDRLFSGRMGDLVGKNDQGVDIPQLRSHVIVGAGEKLQFGPEFFGLFQVVGA